MYNFDVDAPRFPLSAEAIQYNICFSLSPFARSSITPHTVPANSLFITDSVIIYLNKSALAFSVCSRASLEATPCEPLFNLSLIHI